MNTQNPSVATDAREAALIEAARQDVTCMRWQATETKRRIEYESYTRAAGFGVAREITGEWIA